MIVRRDRSRGGWTPMPNAAFELGPSQGGLSLEAKGLLGWLLVKPDAWVVNIAAIRSRCGVGRDTAYALLAELIEAGYVERRQVRDGGRVASYEYVVFDEPAAGRGVQVPENPEAAVVQVPGLPDPDLPDPVNQDAYIRHPTEDKNQKGVKTSIATHAARGGEGREDQRMFDALCAAFSVTPASVTAKTRGQFNRWIKAWRDDGVSSESLARATVLYLDTYKGRRREPPSRHDLDVQIARARAETPGAGAGAVAGSPPAYMSN